MNAHSTFLRYGHCFGCCVELRDVGAMLEKEKLAGHLWGSPGVKQQRPGEGDAGGNEGKQP